jgi:predicted MFS family arabinose efflux permease
MISSLGAGSMVASLGPGRTSQIAMLLVGCGSIVASLPHLAPVVLGSLVIGSAYGLINPAASDLLIRHSPPARRNLVFSIKQTGVPLGGMAAGLIGPSLSLAIGWSGVLWCIAGISLLLMLATQTKRAIWDAQRRGGAFRPALSLGSLRVVAKRPALLCLALASFCFSAIQLSVIGFLVVLLVDELGFDLVSAGILLAAVQVLGAVGRILWGLVADRLRNGLAVLLFLGVLMAAVAAIVTQLAPGWPISLVSALFLVLGLSAVGWNGVYLSEIARLSPREAVGSVTGAAMFVTFMGVFVGPGLFSALHGFLGSYARSYGLLVGLALAAAALLAAVRWRGRAAI